MKDKRGSLYLTKTIMALWVARYEHGETAITNSVLYYHPKCLPYRRVNTRSKPQRQHKVLSK